MSLQFIMGLPGSGKSHYLYQNFIEQSESAPEKHFLLLVPDQYNMQAQKDYIKQSPKSGMLNVEILSFGRLAHRILEENGGMDEVLLDEVGKSFVLRKVVENCLPELKIIKGQIKKVGYIEELKSALSEFAQYGVSPEDLDELLNRMKPESSLYYKMKDLQLIYAGFQAYMKGKYITGEERMELLCELIEKSQLLKGSVIALDGFTGFTYIQKKLIRKLFSVSEKVTVSVTMRENENPFGYNRNLCQLFGLSKETIFSLSQIAKEEGIRIEEPVYLYDEPVWRYKDNAVMGFLAEHLFSQEQKKYIEPQEHIQICHAKSPREEVEAVAGQIRRLIRKENYCYRDIAIVVPCMDTYSYFINEVFADYDIPVFMDSKRSILLNSFVEYLRSLLNMTEQNFSYESVLRYLRTGMTCLSTEEVDRLENYIRAAGLRGYNRWKNEWVKTTRMVDEGGLVQMNQLRERLVNEIDDTVEVLKRRHKTIADITTALHELFLKVKMQQKLKEYEVHFANEGKQVLAKEYAQIYRIMMDLFDQFVSLLGEEKLSLKEYCDLLDAGLSHAQVGTIPPTLDGVVVGDIERSRLPEVRAVFMLGLNDTYIPGTKESGGFLSDYDRTELAKEKVELAPTTKENVYIQKFYLYLVMSKPSQLLYLSYSRISSEGKGLRPSYVIGTIKRMYPSLVEQAAESLPTEWTTRNGLQVLIQGLQQKHNGLSEEWKELLKWYKNAPEWKEKVEQILRASMYHRPDDKLTEEVARQLYGTILHNSISRLETFMSCAYAHFLTYGLQLQEREEASFRALDFGNVFHKALELYSRKLEKEGYTWVNVPEDARERLVEESVQESTLELQSSALFESAREGYAIKRIRRMMYRTVWALSYQLEKGDFLPAGYEVSFKRNIPIDETCSMQLRGVIDRVDICEESDKVYVKIIDYKTGKKTFDISSLYYGLQMQLITYLRMAMEMQKDSRPGKEVIPSGIMYYTVTDPLVNDFNDEEKEKMEMLKALKPDGLLNSRTDSIYHLDKEPGQYSTVMPAGMKNDGTLTAKSHAIAQPEWELLMEYSEKMLQNAGKQILGGDISIAPYKQGDETKCKYCPYTTICKFDENMAGCDYRRLTSLKTNEVLEMIGKEKESWESNSQKNSNK